MKKIVLLFLLVLISLIVFVVLKIVILEVLIMNCVICFFMVKNVLKNVEGVSKVEVIFEIKLVVVIFDDEKIIVKVLIEVIIKVGYLLMFKE